MTEDDATCAPDREQPDLREQILNMHDALDRRGSEVAQLTAEVERLRSVLRTAADHEDSHGCDLGAERLRAASRATTEPFTSAQFRAEGQTAAAQSAINMHGRSGPPTGPPAPPVPWRMVHVVPGDGEYLLVEGDDKDAPLLARSKSRAVLNIIVVAVNRLITAGDDAGPAREGSGTMTRSAEAPGPSLLTGNCTACGGRVDLIPGNQMACRHGAFCGRCKEAHTERCLSGAADRDEIEHLRHLVFRYKLALRHAGTHLPTINQVPAHLRPVSCPGDEWEPCLFCGGVGFVGGDGEACNCRSVGPFPGWQHSASADQLLRRRSDTATQEQR